MRCFTFVLNILWMIVVFNFFFFGWYHSFVSKQRSDSIFKFLMSFFIFSQLFFDKDFSDFRARVLLFSVVMTTFTLRRPSWLLTYLKKKLIFYKIHLFWARISHEITWRPIQSSFKTPVYFCRQKVCSEVLKFCNILLIAYF